MRTYHRARALRLQSTLAYGLKALILTKPCVQIKVQNVHLIAKLPPLFTNKSHSTDKRPRDKHDTPDRELVEGVWYLSLAPIASEDVEAPADERCSVIGSG